MALKIKSEEISKIAFEEYKKVIEFMIEEKDNDDGVVIIKEYKFDEKENIKDDFLKSFNMNMEVFYSNLKRQHTETGKMKEKIEYNYLNVLDRSVLKKAGKMKEILRDLKNSSIVNGFEVEDYLDEINIIYVILKDQVLEMSFNEKDIIFNKKERSENDLKTDKEIKDFQKIIKSLVK